MKTILLPLLICISQLVSAQDWVRMMNDPAVNFYDVQDAFNRQEKKFERSPKQVLNRIFRWSKEEEQETPGYEVYKRWEYFNAPRVYPSGNRIQPDAVWNEYLKQPALHEAKTSGNWTALGPTSMATNSYNPGLGRVNVVATDPADSSIIYIGAPAGGLWKSVDFGNTWQQPTTDELPSIGVSSIVIDHTNSQIIYIGTGDGDATDTYSTGVLKSTDGGATWAQSGLSWTKTQARRICKMLMDPNDPLVIFAAANNGIYKSTDGAATWTLVKNGNFRDMEFKPGNSQVVYATSEDNFFRSDDGGNTFNQITAGLPSSTSVERYAIAVTEADSNYIYIVASSTSGSDFLGMWRSTDGGNTFSQRSTSPNILIGNIKLTAAAQADRHGMTLPSAHLR
jgi:hypothetical protein